jgi:hypothetical protein
MQASLDWPAPPGSLATGSNIPNVSWHTQGKWWLGNLLPVPASSYFFIPHCLKGTLGYAVDGATKSDKIVSFFPKSIACYV